MKNNVIIGAICGVAGMLIYREYRKACSKSYLKGMASGVDLCIEVLKTHIKEGEDDAVE